MTDKELLALGVAYIYYYVGGFFTVCGVLGITMFIVTELAGIPITLMMVGGVTLVAVGITIHFFNPPAFE